MTIKLYTNNKTLEKHIYNFIMYHKIKGDFIPRFKNDDNLNNDTCIILFGLTFIHNKDNNMITLHFSNISIDILKNDIIEYVIQPM